LKSWIKSGKGDDERLASANTCAASKRNPRCHAGGLPIDAEMTIDAEMN
jgi:hypothetical protein